MTSNEQEKQKEIVGTEAIRRYVKSDSVVGLGTGSTAKFAVSELSRMLTAKKVSGVLAIPTSEQTRAQAEAEGVPLTTLDDPELLHKGIDVTVDGADEVTVVLGTDARVSRIDLVKGRGAAMLREKMVESRSKRFVCIVDKSKLNFRDGEFFGLGRPEDPLPVEVVKFGANATCRRLAELSGAKVKLREGCETDNGNLVANLFFAKPISNPKDLDSLILKEPGVVESGLFIGLATSVMYYDDTSEQILVINIGDQLPPQFIQN